MQSMSAFLPVATPIREAIGLAQDDIVIGTVAQISHRKGIDLFLDTAERLLDSGKKFKFVIVGPKAVGEEPLFSIHHGANQEGPAEGERGLPRQSC